jgi:hypothetical protein
MTRDHGSRAEIQNALRQLAATIDTPPAPDYADLVVQQLRSEIDVRSRAPRYLAVRGARRVLLAAALVLILAGVLAAVPGTRHAIASWFDFSGIRIHSEPGSTVATPTTPAPLAAGRQVTLAEAQHAAADRVTLPADLPPPTRVYLHRDRAALVVTLAYRSSPSLKPTPETGFALVVTEIFDAGEPILEKILLAGASAESVQIRGHVGVFIHGPQAVINFDRAASSQGSEVVHEVPPRASANTLIWSDGTATYRIEGALTRDAAVSLANSFD